MLDAGAGLTDVPTAALRTLLRHLHRGDVAAPLDIVALTRIGLQDRANALLSVLRDLDGPAVRAVLVVAVAERLPANRERRLRAESAA